MKCPTKCETERGPVEEKARSSFVGLEQKFSRCTESGDRKGRTRARARDHRDQSRRPMVHEEREVLPFSSSPIFFRPSSRIRFSWWLQFSDEIFRGVR